MSLNVILIERDIHAARALAAGLERHGHRIVGLAEVAEDALAIAEGEEPDCSALRVAGQGDHQLHEAAEALFLTYAIPTLYFAFPDVI